MIVRDMKRSARGVRATIGSILRETCRLWSNGPCDQLAGEAHEQAQHRIVIANLSRCQQWGPFHSTSDVMLFKGISRRQFARMAGWSALGVSAESAKAVEGNA